MTPLARSITALLLLTLAGCNIVPDARASLRYQPLDLSGDFAATTGVATTASSFEALGLGDSVNTVSPRAELSFAGFDLMVSAFEYSNDGSGTAQGSIDLGGTTISGGEMVTTDLDLTNAVAQITWDVVPTDLVDFGIGVGVSYIDLGLTINGAISGTGSTEESLPVPVLAARAEVELGPLTANVHVHGLKLEYDGTDATYIDADLFLSYGFSELLGVDAEAQLGYRFITLDLEYEDGSDNIDANLEFSGIYFGLAFRL